MRVLNTVIVLYLAHFVIGLLLLLSQLVCELIDLSLQRFPEVFEGDYDDCDIVHGLLCILCISLAFQRLLCHKRVL